MDSRVELISFSFLLQDDLINIVERTVQFFRGQSQTQDHRFSGGYRILVVNAGFGSGLCGVYGIFTVHNLSMECIFYERFAIGRAVVQPLRIAFIVCKQWFSAFWAVKIALSQ